MPKITVCIPTYNRGHFLRESIQSVLDQTFSDFELLISDNASTDDTPEVVASFKDSRIRYYRQPANIGITPNWRFVVSMANTEFVAPLSDDDLYLPDHLAVALAVIDQYPEVAYYTSPAEYFGKNIVGFLRPLAIADTITPQIYFGPEQAVMFLGNDNPGPMISMVCRKKALNDTLFWGNPDYLPQDLLIMTQLMVQGGFVFGNRVTSRFRLHDTNTSVNRQKIAKWRFNCMVWYGIRWLAQFLLERQLCTIEDIEAHGRHADSLIGHVIPLVLALGSFDSPPELRDIAKRIFYARKDADQFSARFRLARHFGFQTIPIAEKITQIRTGWRP